MNFVRAAWGFLWRVIAIGALALVLLLTLMIVSLRPSVEYAVAPSPDRRVSLVVETETFGGALGGTVSPSNNFYLVGGAFGERVSLGSSYGNWSWRAWGWIDDTTVNVCPLEDDPDRLREAVAVDASGARTLYRITTQCRTGAFGDDDADGATRGYDYGDAKSRTP